MKITKYPFNNFELQEYLNGGLYIWGGDIGCGKSWVTLRQAVMLCTAGKRIYYTSTQERAETTYVKMACIILGINYADFRLRRLSMVDVFKIKQKHKQYLDRFHINTVYKLKTTNIIRDEVIAKGNVDIVFIDSIDILYTNKGSGIKPYIVAEELKEMAVELNIPVVISAYIHESYGGQEYMDILNSLANNINIVVNSEYNGDELRKVLG